MEDRELLRQFVIDRSEAAFAELVRRYVDLVYSSALRQMKDPAGAEEVTQSVFVLLAPAALSGSISTSALSTAKTIGSIQTLKGAATIMAMTKAKAVDSSRWKEM